MQGQWPLRRALDLRQRYHFRNDIRSTELPNPKSEQRNAETALGCYSVHDFKWRIRAGLDASP